MRASLPLLLLCYLISGCATHVVQVEITNHTGAAVKNVEVTFGGGTYGRSSLAADATHRNRIKIFNTAPIQLQLDDASGKHLTFIGPSLSKNAEGSVAVSIDANGAHWSRQ